LIANDDLGFVSAALLEDVLCDRYAMQAQIIVRRLEATTLRIWQVVELLILGIDTLLPPKSAALFAPVLAFPAPFAFPTILLLPAIPFFPVHLEGEHRDTFE
jgi:hypothetical protein